MIKKVLTGVFIVLSVLPAIAGDFEKAIKSKNKVIAYFYTQECGYCKRFNPIYNKYSKLYDKDYAFVKIDANSNYGYPLFRKYKGKYVPYVLLIDSKSGNASNIQTACLMNTNCLDKVLKNNRY